MTEIPAQHSYEHVPTDVLNQALELNAAMYYRLLDQIEAVQVTRAAIRNVLIERRQAEGQAAEDVA